VTGADSGCELCRARFIDVGDEDLGAFGSEAFGNRRPEPLCAAGHQRLFSSEASVHCRKLTRILAAGEENLGSAYLIAMGLMGVPTAPVNGNAVAMSWNS
jgi:hypothetical protein